jgi:hypothetical protein
MTTEEEMKRTLCFFALIGSSMMAISQSKDKSDSTLFLSGDVWILKVNSMGDTLWTKTYKVADTMIWGCILKPTSDKGYIVSVLGVVDTSFQCDNHFRLMKLDSLGEITWNRGCCGSAADDYETPDGNFIIAGERNTHFLL